LKAPNIGLETEERYAAEVDGLISGGMEALGSLESPFWLWFGV
jgi:hypothetical protein